MHSITPIIRRVDACRLSNVNAPIESKYKAAVNWPDVTQI